MGTLADPTAIISFILFSFCYKVNTLAGNNLLVFACRSQNPALCAARTETSNLEVG